jgi:hypothetical protein
MGWPPFALAVAIALGPAAAADEYDGRYLITPDASCSAPDSAPGLLRIEDGVLHGAESVCRMTQPVAVRGMDATLYDMVCTGEGLAWRERAMLMHGAEGELVLLWDGYAFAYPACPAPPTRPRPRPGAGPELASD